MCLTLTHLIQNKIANFVFVPTCW
jgi:hypothetical protein